MTDSKVHVVTLGELLIDMVAQKKGVSLFDAPAFEPKPGGAPANVAVGVQRLGKQAAFVGKVGSDDFGRGLRQTLHTEGVDVHNLLTDDEALTTLAFISHTDSGDPSFAFFEGAHNRLAPADLDVDLIRGASVFHCGSVSLLREPAFSATWAAVRMAKAAGVVFSYDINWRPLLWRGQSVEKAAAPFAVADVIKMNEGELALVTGESDPRVGLARFNVPARLVLITLGAKGCLYRFGGEIGEAFAPPVEHVVDATGAGDSFMAATLAGLNFPLESMTFDYVGRLAARACQAGAIATQTRGAIPSLPHLAQLDPLE